MSEIAISVENLGKQYRIGVAKKQSRNIAERTRRLLTAPFEYLRSVSHAPSEAETIWALKDLSFEVKRGEVVGIIGRNGTGKSTLLKILSRITEPTEGHVQIHGRVASLLEVGAGFHPELTGRENIYLNGAILGMKKAEIDRKFNEIVAFAEVEKFIDTAVKHYSSGMYVRLAFAVAAHLEPEILLVDEVLAVGDAAFQRKCLGKMNDVAKEGRTILFVSHNMTAVKSLCTRALWLDQGQIAQSGEVAQVVQDYLQKGTISLLEEIWDNPMTAPGNEKVRMHSARVFPLTQSPNDGISVETPIQLEFEFWNYVPDSIINFTMHLFTIEGLYVLAVGSDAKPRQQGLVRGVVKIPPNFLNDGIYRLNLQIVKDASSTLYLHPDILVFEVQDSERVGGWFGKWPGVVRPKFEWFTENISRDGGVHEGS